MPAPFALPAIRNASPDMTAMFGRARSFDQDLSRWEVRGDCQMLHMFYRSPLQYRAPEWWRR